MQREYGNLSIKIELGYVIKIGDDITLKFYRNLKRSGTSLLIQAPKDLKITLDKDATDKFVPPHSKFGVG